MMVSLEEYMAEVRSWDAIYAFSSNYIVHKVFIAVTGLDENPPHIVVITRGEDKNHIVIRRTWIIILNVNKPQMFKTRRAAEEAAMLRKLSEPYGY